MRNGHFCVGHSSHVFSDLGIPRAPFFAHHCCSSHCCFLCFLSSLPQGEAGMSGLPGAHGLPGATGPKVTLNHGTSKAVSQGQMSGTKPRDAEEIQ